MPEIIVIAHNMRSTFNVGSLFRTAEGLGVKKLYLTGYTPYPKQAKDPRLPHLANKLQSQIHKTALGAENSVAWEYVNEISEVINKLQSDGWTVAALEQSDKSMPLPEFRPSERVALVLGTEISGLPQVLLDLIPLHLEIPMFGNKESFNVVIAAAMALYQLRFDR